MTVSTPATFDTTAPAAKKPRASKGKGKATNGASTGVDVRELSPDSGSSRPESRQARVEEVPDDS